MANPVPIDYIAVTMRITLAIVIKFDLILETYHLVHVYIR